MQPYIIGVDIGTGSVKAVALDKEGKVLASAQLHYEIISNQPGYAEQDATIIWNQFVSCIRNIVSTLKQAPSLISLSSYMHGIMAVDDKGVLLTNLITWADTRSEKIALEIRQSAGSEDLYRATGAPIHSMLPLCKIKWLKENEALIFEKSNRFISIKEYIWFRLFNVYEIDYSIAGATGLFNFHTRSWYQPSLNICGIRTDQLSVPVETRLLRSKIQRSAADVMGTDTGINFCIGSSDGCLAVIGSGALGSGKAGLTIGTSGAIRLLNPIPVYHYPEMIFNYLLEDGMFICGGPVNNGGNTVQWLLKTFWDKTKVTQDDYRQLFKYIEEIATGSNGLLFLPYIHGERSPVWDEKASGVFVGIRPEHTKAHFSKAVLEGICFGLNMVLELLNESIPIEQINVSGGFTHAPGWLQLLSDISGKRLCLPHNEDASALGAAFIGMKSAGWIKDYNISVQSDAPIIEPDMENYKKYKDLFDVFKSLYGNLNGTMHQLYDLNK